MMVHFSEALADAESDLMRHRHRTLARARVAARIEGREQQRRPSGVIAVFAGGAALCAAIALFAQQPDPIESASLATPVPERTPSASPGTIVTPEAARTTPPAPAPAPASASPPVALVPRPAATTEGTLVALIVGGVCEFSVDGVKRGSGASIRVKVPVGVHLVACRQGDDTKVQRVVVAADKPGIASFRSTRSDAPPPADSGQSFDMEAQRSAIVEKMRNNSATKSDLRILIAICSSLGDTPCRNEAYAKWKAMD
jgi:hypothetical protein